MKSKTWRERFFSFIGFLFVMVLPILAPIWFLDRITRETEIRAAKDVEFQLDREIQSFIFESDSREIFRKSFWKIYDKLEKQDFSKESILNLPSLLPDFLQAQIAAFTPEGRLEVPRWGTVTSRYLVQKWWDDLLDEVDDVKRIKMYRGLFGSEFLMNDSRASHGFLYPIGPGSGEGAMLWHKLKKTRGGLLIFTPDFQSSLSGMNMTLKNFNFSGFTGICNIRTGENLASSDEWPEWKHVISLSALNGGGTIISGERLCRIVRHPDGLWIIRAADISLIIHSQKRVYIWLLGLFAVLGAIFWWIKKSASPLEALKLSPRILILFLIAVVIPGMLLLCLGLIAFTERSMELEREVHEKNMELMRETDIAFQKRQKSLLAMFRRIKHDPRIYSDNQKKFDELYYPLRNKKLLIRIETRKIDGSLLTTNDVRENFLQLGNLFSKEVLRRYLNADIPRSNDLLEDFAVAMLLSPRLGMTGIFDHPDLIHPLALGKKGVMWYWDVMAPTITCPMAFVAISQIIDWEIDWFLKSRVDRKIQIYDMKNRLWYPKPPANESISALVAQALLGMRAVRQVFRMDGKLFLASAYPSLAMKGYCYLTCTSLEDARRKVDRLRHWLTAGAILIFLMAFLYSRILSSSIMTPIEHISSGIIALEGKQLDFRIPRLDQDELGRLGKAFNGMMDEMREVNFAREVQQSLLPAVPPEFPGFEIGLMNRSASDLGGDYCDALVTSDGKLLVLTGDVTGHGISSALLTAMAKTLCYLSAKENKTIPELLLRLNELITHALLKKKLMTLVLALIDRDSKMVEWASVGHPYPIVRKADGTIVILKMPQYPLGVRVNPQWKTQTFLMEPGDMLVFCTDGMIEAFDERENMFGYERFQETISGLHACTATEAVQKMLDAYEAHVHGAPLADDLTLLAVRRTP